MINPRISPAYCASLCSQKFWRQGFYVCFHKRCMCTLLDHLIVTSLWVVPSQTGRSCSIIDKRFLWKMQTKEAAWGHPSPDNTAVLVYSLRCCCCYPFESLEMRSENVMFLRFFHHSILSHHTFPDDTGWNSPGNVWSTLCVTAWNPMCLYPFKRLKGLYPFNLLKGYSFTLLHCADCLARSTSESLNLPAPKWPRFPRLPLKHPSRKAPRSSRSGQCAEGGLSLKMTCLVGPTWYEQPLVAYYRVSLLCGRCVKAWPVLSPTVLCIKASCRWLWWVF